MKKNRINNNNKKVREFSETKQYFRRKNKIKT